MSGPGLDTLKMQASLESKLFGLSPPALTVGRFTVLERLGHGGMGIVYSVYDETLDRRVALKVLRGGSTRPLRQRLQPPPQHERADKRNEVGHQGEAWISEVAWGVLRAECASPRGGGGWSGAECGAKEAGIRAQAAMHKTRAMSVIQESRRGAAARS